MAYNYTPLHSAIDTTATTWTIGFATANYSQLQPKSGFADVVLLQLKSIEFDLTRLLTHRTPDIPTKSLIPIPTNLEKILRIACAKSRQIHPNWLQAKFRPVPRFPTNFGNFWKACANPDKIPKIQKFASRQIGPAWDQAFVEFARLESRQHYYSADAHWATTGCHPQLNMFPHWVDVLRNSADGIYQYRANHLNWISRIRHKMNPRFAPASAELVNTAK
ncbi:hypothetical protein C8R44DRAFT_728637 [Mycena epipterygia]|nr:hypothetical protein C8R44DRAFT_728637 [Mycena epipterygia]